MSEMDFFQEVEHTPVTWKQFELHVPLFYQKFMLMTVSFIASLEGVKTLLPSARLKPIRISPWHSIISLTAYKYQESDIGAYNEVSIAVPVTLDQETPMFTGVFRKLPGNLMSYILQLPVTTEIARDVGVEVAGYPKFIADIQFHEEENWIRCHLAADDQMVMEMSGRKLSLNTIPRYRANGITYRHGYILRSEFVISEREMGISRNGDDVQLKLGSHPISERLRSLNVGKMLSYGYCPFAQGILTPVIESFAG